MKQEKKYTAEVFVRRYTSNGTLTGWLKCESFSIRANSLEKAIKSIEREATEKFQSSVIHIDKILGPNKNLLYNTAWDDFGPVMSFKGENYEK